MEEWIRISVSIACIASVSIGLSVRWRRFFAFWLRKNWGERNTDGSSGEGEGRREKEMLARKPMILKNAPLTLLQLDKFTV